MKVIERKMVEAWDHDRSMKCDNTRVTSGFSGKPGTETWIYGTSVELFGNEIARKSNNKVRFTLAGWNTTTTRSRLRALGIYIHTRKGIPYYNGEPISPHEWYTVL